MIDEGDQVRREAGEEDCLGVRRLPGPDSKGKQKMNRYDRGFVVAEVEAQRLPVRGLILEQSMYLEARRLVLRGNWQRNNSETAS